jgi:beta-galactosidase
VALRVVPPVYLENIFAWPKNVLSARPSLEVECLVQFLEAATGNLSLEAALVDGDTVLAKNTRTLPASGITKEAQLID